MNIIRTHRELEVYRLAYKLALDIYELSKIFPRKEIYSLNSQIKRSSRSVPANLAEAFRKRRYQKAFIAKLSDAEAESAETHTWLDFSRDHGYLSENNHADLSNKYELVISMIIKMINNPDKWTIK